MRKKWRDEEFFFFFFTLSIEAKPKKQRALFRTNSVATMAANLEPEELAAFSTHS